MLVNLADGFAEVAGDDTAPGAPLAASDSLSDIEHVLGNTANDTLIGNGVGNFLLGGGGDDSLAGGAGNDTLFAGQGADRLEGDDGFDTTDFSTTTANLTLDLTAGTESATGSTLAGVEAALGGAGSDSITGDGSINYLGGRGGDDTIRGMDGADTLLGGVGDNLLDGMDGEDLVDYGWSAAGVRVNLAGGTAANGGGTDTILRVEHVAGGASNDTLVGDGANNYLDGRGGADNVFGGLGSDTLGAGQGADTLDGGDGLDFVDRRGATAGMEAILELGAELTTGAALLSIEGAIGSGYADFLDGDENGNWLDGRDGNDTIHGHDSQYTLIGGLGRNVIDGGEGAYDVLRYDWLANGAVVVDLDGGIATGAGLIDAVSNIEVVIGTAADDAITGGAEDNYFQGALGDDTLTGGAGRDTIASGDGQDSITGGDGFDLVDFGGAAGAVLVDLAGGIEATTGTVLTTTEAVIGSNFNDVLTGDGADNWLSGGTGNDILYGGLGSDTLIGGGGADLIDFEAGDGYDAIFGFETGVDVIDASNYSADPAYAPNVFEYGSDLVIAFQNGDNLYLVGQSLATFNAATDLRL